MDWSIEGIHRRLGKPADWVPATGDEAEAAHKTILGWLKADTKSGYQEIYIVGRNYQVKPYVGPGKQRNLGSFPTVELAAGALLDFKRGIVPLPPSPKKDRNKRGEGRRPRLRPAKPLKAIAKATAKAKATSPTTVTADLVEVSDVPPADAILVACVPA